MSVEDALLEFLMKLREAYATVTCDDIDERSDIMASLQM